MSKPIATIIELAFPDGDRMVDALINREGSQFAAHVDQLRPEHWRVSHISTGFGASGTRLLTKAEAVRLAAALDKLPGFDKLRRKGSKITGLTNDMKSAANKALSEFDALRHKLARAAA